MPKKKPNFFLYRIQFSALAFTLMLFSCASTRYIDPDKIGAVSDKFGFKDTDIVVNDMVKRMTNEFLKKQKNQVILLDRVRNRTAEHVDTKSLRDQIRKALIAKGIVNVDKESRAKIMEEQKHALSDAAGGNAINLGQLKAANLILVGYISSSEIRKGLSTIKVYQISMHITSTETGTILWSGTKRLAKQVNESLLRL